MLQNIFDRIYLTDEWNGGSGPGSHPSNTAKYVKFLNSFIRENSIKSILDIGCGDWQLMSMVDLSGVRYKGIDVSPVATSLARSKAPAGADISNENIENIIESFDLVHIKDVLQHLEFSECRRILEIISSRHKSALVVNEHPPASNDIKNGQYRPLSIVSEPLCWPRATVIKVFTNPLFRKSVTYIHPKQ
jgi:SAM-dependent methyltransferase